MPPTARASCGSCCCWTARSKRGSGVVSKNGLLRGRDARLTSFSDTDSSPKRDDTSLIFSLSLPGPAVTFFDTNTDHAVSGSSCGPLSSAIVLSMRISAFCFSSGVSVFLAAAFFFLGAGFFVLAAGFFLVLFFFVAGVLVPVGLRIQADTVRARMRTGDMAPRVNDAVASLGCVHLVAMTLRPGARTRRAEALPMAVNMVAPGVLCFVCLYVVCGGGSRLSGARNVLVACSSALVQLTK